MRHKVRPVLAAVVLGMTSLLSSTAASAAPIAYTASQTSTSPPSAPGGRCPDGTNLAAIGDNVGTASGTSTFGPYEPTTSHCISGPVDGVRTISDGLFTWLYEKGSLFGTYVGLVYPTETLGVFNPVQDYTITGGTGLFAGATGSVTSNGLISFGPGGVSTLNLEFTGQIDIPAPPAAALFGLAALGLAVRRQRNARLAAVG